MNRKEAIQVLRTKGKLTDEAALLILLVKYSHKLTKKDEELIDDLYLNCPLCAIHCKGHNCTVNGTCPWLRFTKFKTDDYSKACIKWRSSSYAEEVKFESLPEEILSKRKAMILDWLKEIRKES